MLIEIHQETDRGDIVTMQEDLMVIWKGRGCGNNKQTTKGKAMRITIIIGAVLAAIFALAGCASTGKAITNSASGKNLNLEGYVMLGKIETSNPETGTPQGEMIMGRVTYKSRRVGIPADQKVPTAGYFKATKTKSFFGTEEIIIEYDFTAGSDKDAETALKELEKRKKATEKSFAIGKTDSVNATAQKDTGAGMNTPTVGNAGKTP